MLRLFTRCVYSSTTCLLDTYLSTRYLLVFSSTYLYRRSSTSLDAGPRRADAGSGFERRPCLAEKSGRDTQAPDWPVVRRRVPEIGIHCIMSASCTRPLRHRSFPSSRHPSLQRRGRVDARFCELTYRCRPQSLMRQCPFVPPHQLPEPQTSDPPRGRVHSVATRLHPRPSTPACSARP